MGAQRRQQAPQFPEQLLPENILRRANDNLRAAGWTGHWTVSDDGVFCWVDESGDSTLTLEEQAIMEDLFGSEGDSTPRTTTQAIPDDPYADGNWQERFPTHQAPGFWNEVEQAPGAWGSDWDEDEAMTAADDWGLNFPSHEAAWAAMMEEAEGQEAEEGAEGEAAAEEAAVAPPVAQPVAQGGWVQPPRDPRTEWLFRDHPGWLHTMSAADWAGLQEEPGLIEEVRAAWELTEEERQPPAEDDPVEPPQNEVLDLDLEYQAIECLRADPARYQRPGAAETPEDERAPGERSPEEIRRVLERIHQLRDSDLGVRTALHRAIQRPFHGHRAGHSWGQAQDREEQIDQIAEEMLTLIQHPDMGWLWERTWDVHEMDWQ